LRSATTSARDDACHTSIRWATDTDAPTLAVKSRLVSLTTRATVKLVQLVFPNEVVYR